MTFSQIKTLLNAEVICGENLLDNEITSVFASDLMSDVLTIKNSHYVLVTGLCNIQTIRTAEMADVRYIIIVRGKQVTEEMIELAKENDMLILQCEYSMFRTAGILWENGMKPIY